MTNIEKSLLHNKQYKHFLVSPTTRQNPPPFVKNFATSECSLNKKHSGNQLQKIRKY
jgi:hypothetical protein